MGVTALLEELLSDRDPLSTSGELVMDMTTGPDIGLGHGVSPRSRQIAELCGEMDSCLESLAKWEEDSRNRVDALKREMESQYGFSYEEQVRFPAVSDLGGYEADGFGGLPDEHEDSVDEGCCRAVVQLPEPRVEFVRGVPCKPLSKLQLQEDVMRHEDEDRIAKLRAEIEGLKQKEAEMQQEIIQQWLDVEALDGWAPGVAEVQASDIRSVEFSVLCAEADNVLANGCVGDRPPSYSGVVIEGLEARLREARGGLSYMEDRLDSARSRVDSEISELEKLLAERDSGADSPDEEASYRPSGWRPPPRECPSPRI